MSLIELSETISHNNFDQFQGKSNQPKTQISMFLRVKITEIYVTERDKINQITEINVTERAKSDKSRDKCH